MHSANSSINVSVELDVKASGMVMRGDEPAPRQRFVRANPDTVRHGSILLNPLTNQTYRVYGVSLAGVTLAAMLVPWEDVEEAVLVVVED